MQTDIIVYGLATNWKLQRHTERGKEWLQRNGYLQRSQSSVTLDRSDAQTICARAERDGLIVGAGTYY